MKQRFSSIDVKVIAKELESALTGFRVSNIYDLSSRIFLFKFAKPGKREQVLLDLGFRCHLTSFSRTAASAPSSFVSRLRKYLKSRRVTGVSQVGTDRIIEIVFSDGQYRLFLEFFAAGNIVVTDADLKVLVLQREVHEGDEDVDVKLDGQYKLEPKQNFHGIPPITEERVKAALENAVRRTQNAKEVGGKKAKRAKKGDDVRKALSNGFPELPYHLIDHVFVETHTDATLNADAVLADPEALQATMKVLERADTIFKSFDVGQSKGYIVAKTKTSHAADTQSAASSEPKREDLLYDDFHPFRPAQFEGQPDIHILEFDGFNRTVDEFYSSIESQRLESRLTEREETAKRKLEATRSEHEKRLTGLQNAQEVHVRKAQAIEANTHRVEEACAAVNGLIAQGMDWVNIGKLIENEQGRGNVVAQMVKLPLKLEENTVTLLLDEPGFDGDSESDQEDATDDDSESEDDALTKSRSVEKRLAIDIDLSLSPWANARQYHEQKKTAADKQKRTVEASAKALKSVEQKIESDLKKGLKAEKTALRPARKQFWFEKFLYFISSDGYLVIGGKDAQQNDLLYRRYLKKGDIYVHADLQGASSVLVKNNPKTPDAPIPPSTLSQAGALTVCTSSAWDSKAVMSAWWVNADQVSKTAPAGEYLTTGGFIIRGHKNFLPPSQLLLGFGVVWLISEESKGNHGKFRLDRTESMLDGEAEALANDARGMSLEEKGSEDEAEASEDQAVPDVEDAADAAAADDNGSGGSDPNDQQELQDRVEDGDEGYESAAASDVEEDTLNPLQLPGANTLPQNEDANEDHGSDGDKKAGVEIEADAQGSSEQGDEDQDTTEAATPSTRPSTPTASSLATSAKPKPAQLARGKRSKAKRAAKKYAEQDDEDRALAMQLLGSNRGQEQKQEAEAERAARAAKAQADKERRKAQHDKAAERERQRHERLEKQGGQPGRAVDENAGELSREQVEQERLEFLAIDRLVAAPEPGDELLAAIPVVAPWSALTRQKYKVKLQPGSVKKGKAVKEIVGFWTSLGSKGPKVVDEGNREREKVWSREVELLKEWRVEEVVGYVPVKGCRIIQGGGLAGSLVAGGSGGGGGKGKGGAGGKGRGGGKKGR